MWNNTHSWIGSLQTARRHQDVICAAFAHLATIGRNALLSHYGLKGATTLALFSFSAITASIARPSPHGTLPLIQGRLALGYILIGPATIVRLHLIYRYQRCTYSAVTVTQSALRILVPASRKKSINITLPHAVTGGWGVHDLIETPYVNYLERR